MRILVLFAHPKAAESIVQRAMLSAIAGLADITLHDLYDSYPDFNIDVDEEQKLLLAHDLIILQHPIYWYSSPSIIKEWLDLVLEYGWAYGRSGQQLHGKWLMQAVSTGSSSDVYSQTMGHTTINQILTPFSRTAHTCGMGWLTPFVIYHGRQMPKSDLNAQAEAYRDLLLNLRDERLSPFKRVAKGYDLPKSFPARKVTP